MAWYYFVFCTCAQALEPQKECRQTLRAHEPWCKLTYNNLWLNSGINHSFTTITDTSLNLIQSHGSVWQSNRSRTRCAFTLRASSRSCGMQNCDEPSSLCARSSHSHEWLKIRLVITIWVALWIWEGILDERSARQSSVCLLQCHWAVIRDSLTENWSISTSSFILSRNHYHRSTTSICTFNWNSTFEIVIYILQDAVHHRFCCYPLCRYCGRQPCSCTRETSALCHCHLLQKRWL